MDSDRLLLRFDAWEARMRGHSTRPYRVSLEPEYRPLLGRERTHRGIIDDARTPGLFERIAPKKKRRERHGEPEPIPSPVPHEGLDETVELQLLVRPDTSVNEAMGAALLNSLAGAEHHLGFEILGLSDRIVVQLVCDEKDRLSVRGSLRAHAPEVKVVEARDYLWEKWQDEEHVGAIASFGLEDRVFHKLRSLNRIDSDPLSELVGKMEDLKQDEVLLLQVLFAPALAPWRKDIEEFVSSIEDVDGVLPLVKEKFSEPMFAAVVRIAALAESEEAALALVRSMAMALVSTTASSTNRLILLDPPKHSFEEEAKDLIARQTRRRGMLLSRSELQTLVRLPSASVHSAKLLRATTRTKAAPAMVQSKGLILGMNEHEEGTRPVALSVPQRLRHIHIVGSSGSGKSTLLLSMAMQDIEAGNGFAVLDPHGDLIEDILARIPEERTKDVLLLDPSDEEFPVGFNVLSAHSELERTLLSSDFVAIFRRLSSTTFGDQMVSVLGNAVLAMLESNQGGTLLDLRRFLIDKAFRARFLESVRDDEVVYYWQREFPLLKGLPHAPILTRLNTFLRPKVLRYMVAQRNDRLDFRAIMDGKKILLAKLSHGMIGEENAHLLGSLLVAKIAQATMSRQDEEAAKRMPFTLYLDEFHHFVTPSVAAILSGARKYALGLCLAHHEMRQLKSRSEEVASAVLSNAYTRIVFQVGDQDARTLAEGFSFFQAADLQNLGIGRAIARVERSDFDFNLRTVLPDAVTPKVRQARHEAVRRASRKSFATPRAEVEAGLKASSASEPQTAEQPASESKRTTRKAPQVPPDSSQPPLPGRGGTPHKYLQSLVKHLAEARGFIVSVEKTVLEGHGYVDVALERDDLSVACEISVTTRVTHEVANLTKCLAAGFNYAVLVSSDTRTLVNASSLIADSDRERIRFLTPDNLIAFLDSLAEHDTSPNALIEPPVQPRKTGNQGRLPIEASAATKRMLGTSEAAEYVGLAVQTLAKLRCTGDSPPFFKLGRQVVYEQKDLDEWLDARRRRSTSDSGRSLPDSRPRRS